jgi:hypothetical protein
VNIDNISVRRIGIKRYSHNIVPEGPRTQIIKHEISDLGSIEPKNFTYYNGSNLGIGADITIAEGFDSDFINLNYGKFVFEVSAVVQDKTLNYVKEKMDIISSQKEDLISGMKVRAQALRRSSLSFLVSEMNLINSVFGKKDKILQESLFGLLEHRIGTRDTTYARILTIFNDLYNFYYSFIKSHEKREESLGRKANYKTSKTNYGNKIEHRFSEVLERSEDDLFMFSILDVPQSKAGLERGLKRINVKQLLKRLDKEGDIENAARGAVGTFGGVDRSTFLKNGLRPLSLSMITTTTSFTSAFAPTSIDFLNTKLKESPTVSYANFDLTSGHLDERLTSLMELRILLKKIKKNEFNVVNDFTKEILEVVDEFFMKYNFGLYAVPRASTSVPFAIATGEVAPSGKTQEPFPGFKGTLPWSIEAGATIESPFKSIDETFYDNKIISDQIKNENVIVDMPPALYPHVLLPLLMDFIVYLVNDDKYMFDISAESFSRLTENNHFIIEYLKSISPDPEGDVLFTKSSNWEKLKDISSSFFSTAPELLLCRIVKRADAKNPLFDIYDLNFPDRYFILDNVEGFSNPLPDTTLLGIPDPINFGDSDIPIIPSIPTGTSGEFLLDDVDETMSFEDSGADLESREDQEQIKQPAIEPLDRSNKEY